MPVSRNWRHCSVKGVTFVEASVFLAVVSIILTAILFSAFSLYRYRVVSTTAQQITSVVDKIRNVHVGQARVDRTLTEKNLALAGGFPSEMVFLPLGPKTSLDQVQVLNAWGGAVHVSSETIHSREDAFSLSYQKIPSFICKPLLIMLTNEQRDPGLVGVETFVTGSSSFPLSFEAISRICEDQSEDKGSLFLTYLLEK